MKTPNNSTTNGPRRERSGHKQRAHIDHDALKNLDTTKLDLSPPVSFTEHGLHNHIVNLCEAGKHDAAAKYLLRAADDLLKSNVNPKVKLNHFLFLPRLIQAGSGTKHGYQKLLRKVAGVQNFIGDYTLPRAGAFIDLGCGAHDPLGMATFYYLNGFDPSFGIDLLPLRTERYSALSMYDILSNVRCFPKRYCLPGVEPKQVLERASRFNLGAFERGEWKGGLSKIADKVSFLSSDICDAGLEPQSVSLLVSFAVFEHVSDIDRVCETVFNLLRPGGLAFHFVDLADHRAYHGDKNFGPLSFLTEQLAPANMNRLRAPEVTRAHEKAGFEILKDKRTSVDMPIEIRSGLTERFRDMPDDDLRVIKQQLLVSRPL